MKRIFVFALLSVITLNASAQVQSTESQHLMTVEVAEKPLLERYNETTMLSGFVSANDEGDIKIQSPVDHDLILTLNRISNIDQELKFLTNEGERAALLDLKAQLLERQEVFVNTLIEQNNSKSFPEDQLKKIKAYTEEEMRK